MQPELLHLAVVIQADARIPGGRHKRTLLPTVVSCSWDVAHNSATITIQASGRWHTVEPMILGPEKILWENLHGSKVLQTSRFPQIQFAGTWDGDKVVKGTLELRGISKPITGTVTTGPESELAIRFPVHLPDWNIQRFKALLGLLWVEDAATVEARIRLPHSPS